MNIAIPKINDSIASCFEVAKQFKIIYFKNGKIHSSKIIECHGVEDFQRVRLLRLYEINTLICNGINRFYQDQLLSLGIFVIPNITGNIDTAIKHFTSGKLKTIKKEFDKNENRELVSHDELIKWTKQYFENNGYSIDHTANSDTSLVDLIATINCPVCNKPLKIAICCGAQIYSLHQEIKEFHYRTKTAYESRVYVYQTDPDLAQKCSEYGITYISPEVSKSTKLNNQKNKIPIIQQPIEGHESAFK